MALHAVKSEIAGTVMDISVKPGDEVGAGEPLMFIDSMKMEIPLLTPETGVVDSILAEKGDSILEGQVVANIRSK